MEEIILRFYERLTILEIDQKVIKNLLIIRDFLKKKNQTIETCDLLIASIVFAENRYLLTNNYKHFSVLEEL